MIGCGTVGSGVAKLLRDEASRYAARAGRGIELRRVLVRDAAKAKARGLMADELITTDADAFFATDGLDIIVEVAGGRGPVADYVRRALEAGKPVVTANKALLAAEGAELFALARRHGACIAFEASCAGGIPIVTALKFGLMANRIDAMYGILNGTCNYILTEMTQRGIDYDTALSQAQALGFAEADPALDVSGQDAGQKLAVLASLAFGERVAASDVWCFGVDDLNLADIKFGQELGYDIKLLAIGERTDAGLSLRVHPCFINDREPLAQVHGSFNALSVYGHATGHTMYYGRGAGEMPTAGAVVSDILNIAGGWYPVAFESMNLWPDGHEAAEVASSDELKMRFYLRVNALDVPNVMAQITHVLGESGISISAVLQHESAVGQFVPVVILTHEARQGDIRAAADRIEQLDAINSAPVVIRIIDMPQG
jgi:homoserine dehydrogenase